MFSEGRLIFVIFFVLVFASYLVWAYREDLRKTPWYFKGSLRIALVFIAIYLAYLMLTRYLL